MAVIAWPHPWGRDGSGLMCQVSLNFALILPYCKNLSREVAKDSGQIEPDCPLCDVVWCALIKWSSWAREKDPLKHERVQH